MAKLWLKIIKNNRMIRDITLDSLEDRDEKMELDQLRPEIARACNELDVEFPVVVEANRREFARRQRTVFREDSFIQETDFDKLEVVYFKSE